MEHQLEILKIIEGALNLDHEKVNAYVAQLAKKLADAGDHAAAERLKRATDRSKLKKVALQRFSPAGNPLGQIPIDGESKVPLADEESFREPLPRIVLESGNQQTVDKFITYVQAASRLIAHGVGINPTLLTYGPPGCGKTELARHISARLQLPLVSARFDGLVSSYLGSTAKNIRALFEYAHSRPCVLFLDEFDAVAKLRDDRHELGELKRVVVSLLQSIDSGTNTVLIAATNHEHLLDPAIWRRFAYKVHLQKPTQLAREELFRQYLGSNPDGGSVELLSSLSEGLTGAEIRLLVEDAVRQGIVNGGEAAEVDELIGQIVSNRLDKLDPAPQSEEEILRAAKSLNPRLMTARRLSSIFSVSLGKVSKSLNEPSHGRS